MAVRVEEFNTVFVLIPFKSYNIFLALWILLLKLDFNFFYSKSFCYSRCTKFYRIGEIF